MSSRKSLGKRGEALAAAYLKQQGYAVRETNWRCSSGEVDVIAEAGQTLVFVEVRTRRGRDFGTPEASVTAAKQAKLIELAQTYIQQHDLWDRSWRIDVMAVEISQDDQLERIELIENAVTG